MDAESIKKEAREDIKESWQGDYPRHAVEKIVLDYIDKATLAECNRILKAIPPIRHKITGEYKDRRASGFNECRKLIIKIVKGQDDE